MPVKLEYKSLPAPAPLLLHGEQWMHWAQGRETLITCALYPPPIPLASHDLCQICFQTKFWKWVISTGYTQRLGEVDNHIHVQKYQHCFLVTGEEDGAGEEQGARIAKTALLIEEVTAGAQFMQQPKETGKQFKASNTHPQQPWATRAWLPPSYCPPNRCH